MIDIAPQAALTEGWQTQRKLLDALGQLGWVHDADVEIGTTPKDAVLQIDKTVLYRYRPMVEKPAPVPVVLTYALVGRYTMMDLQEDRSLVATCCAPGSTSMSSTGATRAGGDRPTFEYFGGDGADLAAHRTCSVDANT
jgi:poly(3-hydroxyalkanoate) synthetase